MQSEAGVPALESECVALSQGMRELVAARRLVLELGQRMSMELKTVSKMSKSWEENVGTQHSSSSEGPLMTSRTKHIGTKHSWFRSQIQPDSIGVLLIDTK